jgi:hypothetical protein
MPLFLNVMVFGSVLCLGLGTYFILLMVAILAWLIVRWLIVILTFFWRGMTWFSESRYFAL